jgi:hypothetical protein
MKIYKKNRVPFFIFIALLVLTTILFYFFGVAKRRKNSTDNQIPEKPKTVTCTRTTRLNNDPQYDRALSLIQQRIDDNNKWWNKYGETVDGRFKHFPPELVNCIKISEETAKSTGGLEGYFTFNGEDIKENYYPITVSSDYRLADDIETALLLTHEITHVQQYINTLNGKDSLSCIDKEIEAFRSQLDFYVLLNSEENSSVYNRIQSDKNLHSELQMLDTMMTINRESNCKFEETCLDANLTNKLREMLTSDSYYKKQCGL